VSSSFTSSARPTPRYNIAMVLTRERSRKRLGHSDLSTTHVEWGGSEGRGLAGTEGRVGGAGEVDAL